MRPFFITGSGAVTALGLDAPRTVASLRGGLSGLTQLRFEGASGRDLRAAPVRGFAEGIVGLPRLEALAGRALEECLRSQRHHFHRPPLVYLGLREGEADLASQLVFNLEYRFSWKPGTIRTFVSGRTAVFSALRHAQKALETGAEGCIVGGVDSLVDPAELHRFSELGVLAEEYDGFFPGEAAAFISLSRYSAMGRWGRAAAAVCGIGEADERADGSSQAPLVGVGMSSAMQKALAAAQTSEAAVALFMNAVNGTRSEFEDEAFAQIRLLRTPRKDLSTWHLASYLGETGAAYGALALLWASAALELEIYPAQGVLISASAGSRRAAAFMKAATSPVKKSAEMGPAVGTAEPVLHVATCISSTHDIEGDIGIRLGILDDRHRELCEKDFDELATLLMIREGHFGSDSAWTDIEGFERRALSHLDALAWSADTARDLVQRLLEGEPEEAAAATLYLLCSAQIEGTHTRLLDACAQSPKNRTSIAKAAGLSPRARAEPFLHRLAQVDLQSTRDSLRGLAIGGWLEPGWLLDTMRKLSEPVDELLIALGSLAFNSASAEIMKTLTSTENSGPPEVYLAALVLEPQKKSIWDIPLESLLERAPQAVALAALQEQRSVVSLVGQDAEATVGTMIAIGWSGETKGTQILLAGLDCEEVVARAAARALYLMYGLRPVETVMDDDIQRDRLSQDRAQWVALLKGVSVVSDRLRLGKRWGKNSAVEMLSARETQVPDRTIAIWEHTLLNRQPHSFHPQQWVARQTRALASTLV